MTKESYIEAVLKAIQMHNYQDVTGRATHALVHLAIILSAGPSPLSSSLHCTHGSDASLSNQISACPQ